MPDYCVVCGDADSSNDDGQYVSFESERTDLEPIHVELWVCEICLMNGHMTIPCSVCGKQCDGIGELLTHDCD